MEKDKSQNLWLKCINNRVFFATFLFVVFMAITGLYNVTVYDCDSAYYWTVADPVFTEKFSILQFPETFRGYFFPTIIGCMKALMSALGIELCWGWRIMVSFIMSILIVYVLPTIFDDERKLTRRKFVGIILFVVVFLIFWGDFMQYPLSDLPASFFMLSAIAVLLWLINREINVFSIIGSFIVGGCLYAAYNTRVVFLYGVVLTLAAFAIYSIVKRKYRRLFFFIPIISGMLLLAMPQMFINHQYIGVYSPKVYTEQLFEYNSDLQTQQVFWGLEYSRYETYVGIEEEYLTPHVFFDDPIGYEIIVREGITAEGFGYGTIMKLFLKYPLDVSGIYIRHLISLMSPIFSQVYITDMYAGKGTFITVAIIIWILAFLGVIYGDKAGDYFKYVLIFSCILPALLQMAGAPELRFFMVVYLLLYHYVFSVIDYKLVYNKIIGKRIKVGIVCMIIYLLWISCISSILSNNREKTLLINDNHYYSLTGQNEL